MRSLNEFTPALIAFTVVLGLVFYSPTPLWFKVLVVLSGLVMLVLSAAVVLAPRLKTSEEDA